MRVHIRTFPSFSLIVQYLKISILQVWKNFGKHERGKKVLRLLVILRIGLNLTVTTMLHSAGHDRCLTALPYKVCLKWCKEMTKRGHMRAHKINGIQAEFRSQSCLMCLNLNFFQHRRLPKDLT